jgi:hypothetical protein
MDKIINKKSIAQIIEGSIFYIRYLPDTYSNLDDFIEGNYSFQKLSKGKSMKILFEMAPLASLNLKVNEYNDYYNSDSISAQAIVVNSLAQRLLFSSYLKIGIKKHPIKMFRNKNLALKWLNEI